MTEAVVIDGSAGEVVPVRAQDMLTDLVDDSRALDRAVALADEFRSICDTKGWGVMLKGARKPHLVIEAWQYLGQRMGLTTRTEWCHEVRNPASGDLEGYEARVQVIRVATGDVLGAAQQGAFFEETITTRDGRRVQRWTERHAAMGMAQTRASSRAISSVARFVAELAGFSGTPAEEMPRDVTPPPPRAEPVQRRAAPEGAPQHANGVISENQGRRLWALAASRATALGDANLRADIVRDVLGRRGIEHTRDVPRSAYERICAEVEAWEIPTGTATVDEAAAEEAF